MGLSNANGKEATALHKMSYELTYFYEIFILCYGFKKIQTAQNIKQ